jgi:hypothetical protein
VVAYTVVGPGTASVGGVVSTTATWNDAELLFPWLSAAVHWTVVVPSGKSVCDAGEHETSCGPSTVSTAVGVV